MNALNTFDISSVTRGDRTRDSTDDRHKPVYHFTPASGWLNDPNGLGWWNGRYHLFYQHNPAAPVHDDIHWGHATSTDLLHWRDESIALAPSPGADEDGCWSGALVDDGGVPTLLYSGNREGRQRACIATGDSELLVWEKHMDNPVIRDTPAGLDITEYRDHTVWREGSDWVQLMGAGIRGIGGAVLRYRSSDLRNWSYEGIQLAEDGREDGVVTGDVWECPDFFSLDGEQVLIASAWTEGATERTFACVGSYTEGAYENVSRQRLDYGGHHFYAPQSFTDPDGRRVMFGWVQEGRGRADAIEAGWSGVMSVPRQLSIEKGSVAQRPVAELAALRSDVAEVAARALNEDEVLTVPHRGTAIDIEAVIELGADSVATFAVLENAAGSEQTLIYFDARRGEFGIDRSRSSLDDSFETSPASGTLPMNGDGLVDVRILIDRSVIEIFANGRALTTRVYPTDLDSDRISVRASAGTVELTSLSAWTMNGIWQSQA